MRPADGDHRPLPAFSPLLLRAVLCTLGGLVVGCLLVGLAAIGYLAVASSDRFATLGASAGEVFAIALLAVMIGGLPVLVIGAPGYALLVRWGWANALSAAVLGAAPGLVLSAFQSSPAWLFLVFGVVVALATHALFQWDLSIRSLPR